MGGIDSKGRFGLKRKGMYEKEGNIFAKLKSTIIIIGQKDSEAREVERAEERKGWGIRKAEIIQKKESRRGKLM